MTSSGAHVTGLRWEKGGREGAAGAAAAHVFQAVPPCSSTAERSPLVKRRGPLFKVKHQQPTGSAATRTCQQWRRPPRLSALPPAMAGC